MTRKSMLLAGAGIVAIAAVGIGGQQLYQGQALRAVETGLAQVRKDGIAGNTVAWATQERSGDTVVLRDVTMTAPGGKVLVQAARGLVKPRVTGRIDVTAADVSVAVGNGTDHLHVAELQAENIAVGAVPANGKAANGQAVSQVGGTEAWLAALDGASVRATDLTALDGPVTSPVSGPVSAAPRTAAHLNTLDAAMTGGRLTRLITEGFTAKAPAAAAAAAADVQDVALDRLELSGLDVRRLAALQEAGASADIKDVRAAIRGGDLRLSIRGLRAGPAVLDSGELALTPAGTDRLTLTGGRIGPQRPRPAVLDGIELVSLVTDSRFNSDGWTGEINTEMKGLGRLRFTGVGRGQAQGDAPLTLKRLVVRLEDGGVAARIASASGIIEQNRPQWAQMTGKMAKGVLGQTGTTDTSGLDARLAAFLSKGTPLEFAVEATDPGGIVVPDHRGRSAAAWVPPPGSLRVMAP
ncbi:MAG: hypothetical protein ACRYHQ_34065 [Janthinobacterium lividum]